jgi:carbamoyl-phosphate synthase large subunit
VRLIIEKERPDAVLPTMGGQTALNTALALFKDGTLDRLGVKMIGADAAAIEKAEDRLKFRDAMDKIGLESPRSAIAHSLEEAIQALETTGLPAIIRPSFTLGGTGGGIAYNREEFVEIVASGLDASPTTEVLIEESVLGWKEYEMEVVRDRKDNAIIICAIENVDPMGVHTGDSITVAPALTLTDKEYQIMRNASIACLREIGVETGGSNVQFAVNPADGRLVVIEMNPRVSRSSALASKATGFPIAKVAAKLAVGYTLDEIQNDITGCTPASFEPTIDYVVTKIPRFTFEKFKGAEPLLSTAMKSVGEVMAIGRSFHESLQKALRGLETGLIGLDGVKALYGAPRVEIEAALARATPDRLLVAAQALREGFTVAEVHAIAKYDPWFLERLKEIVDVEAQIASEGLPNDKAGMRRLKAMGFSDRRLAELAVLAAGLKGGAHKVRARSRGLIHDAVRAMVGATTEEEVRELRHRLGVRPVFKRIDTVAAEFAAKTPYMYSTYEAPSFGEPEDESQPSDRRKIVILGGGPNRIGQGHRIRLLLLPRRLRAGRGRFRDDHDQLQPGDGVDRLRHVRPALFRAADCRGRARGAPCREVAGRAGGRDRPVRRADPAEARRRAGKGRDPHPRDVARRHRPRRGPGAVRGAGRPARPQAADERHRPQPRGSDRGGRTDRLSGADAAELRARRAGDGDRRRPCPARRLYRHRRTGIRATARC